MDNITIFGSFVVDLTAYAGHLPVAGETVLGSRFQMGPGGKGSNQAIAAKRAGANVRFVTKLGDDVFGKLALDTYRAEGLDSADLIIEPGAATGSALISVNEQTAENQIVVVPAACETITQSEMSGLFEMLRESRVFLTQLETNYDSVYSALKAAKQAGNTVILNPAPMGKLELGCLCDVDVVTPNEVEAAQLSGIAIESIADARRAAQKLLELGAEAAVITLGGQGVFVKTETDERHIAAFAVDAVDTTGAGDAFNGGFACALGEGKSVFEAAAFASAVAALSVTKPGTAPSMPYRADIDAFLKSRGA